MMMKQQHKKSLWLSAAVLVVLALCRPAAADHAADSGKIAGAKPQHPPFSDFQILINRSMFAVSNKAAPDASKDASMQAPPSQTVRLMGAWLEGDRAVALFEETPGNASQALAPGGFVAGYILQDICTDAIVLCNGQGELELKVGESLGKGEDGSWTPIAQSSPGPPAATTAAPPKASPAPMVTEATGQGPESADNTSPALRKKRRGFSRRK